MKKIMFLALAFAATAAFAGMNNRTLTFEVEGTNVVAKTTTIRGNLATVAVTVPEGATGSVAITSAGEIVFSKSSLSSSATFHPVVQSCGSDGTAITNQYQRFGLGGPTTVTVTGTGTNTVTYKVEVYYQQ